jgi:hypothetical protein
MYAFAGSAVMNSPLVPSLVLEGKKYLREDDAGQASWTNRATAKCSLRSSVHAIKMLWTVPLVPVPIRAVSGLNIARAD